MTYPVGRTSARADRTHLRVEPARAQCGTVLQPELDVDSVDPPTCPSCQLYANLGQTFICDGCGISFKAPAQVVELRHMCQDGRTRLLRPEARQ